MKISFAKILPQLALDIGTSCVRLHLIGQDSGVEVPSCLCVDPVSGEVLAFGQEAAQAVGRGGQVKYLVNQGIASHPSELKTLINWLLPQAGSMLFLAQPTYLISVPVGATSVEALANAEVGRLLGGRQVLTVTQPLAAAIGAKVPLQDSAGCFILHLGAGRLEAAAITLGSIVAFQSSPDAGRFLTQKIAGWLLSRHAVRLAQPDLTAILHQVLSLQAKSDRHLTVKAQTVADGKLKDLTISAGELTDLTYKFGLDTVALVERLLAQLSPDLLTETPVRGLLLSGGLAQLDGLTAFLSDQLQIPVALVDQPDMVVIQGMVKIMQHKQEFLSRAGGQFKAEMIDWS